MYCSAARFLFLRQSYQIVLFLVLQAFFERQMRLSFFVQYLVTFFGTTKKSGWQIDK